MVDAINDAPNDYPAGRRLEHGPTSTSSTRRSLSPNASTLRVTMDHQEPLCAPPPVNLAARVAVFWNYNGTTYYARAQSTGALGVGAFSL